MAFTYIKSRSVIVSDDLSLLLTTGPIAIRHGNDRVVRFHGFVEGIETGDSNSRYKFESWFSTKNELVVNDNSIVVLKCGGRPILKTHITKIESIEVTKHWTDKALTWHLEGKSIFGKYLARIGECSSKGILDIRLHAGGERCHIGIIVGDCLDVKSRLEALMLTD